MESYFSLLHCFLVVLHARVALVCFLILRSSIYLKEVEKHEKRQSDDRNPRIEVVEYYFFQSSAADYYEVMAFFGRIVIMFLIGLQLDLSFLRRNLRAVFLISSAGTLICFIFAGAISYPFFKFYVKEGNTHKGERFPTFVFLLMIAMANSASPLVDRFAAELNIGSSHFGRLVVCSSLVNDVTSLILGAVVRKTGTPKAMK